MRCSECGEVQKDGADICAACGVRLTVFDEGTPPPPPSAPPGLEPGALLAGRYRIESRIGHGGMGTVYAVEDESNGESICLKALHPDLAERGDLARRFIREGTLARDIRHRNIVSVYDVASFDGTYYLTMERLEGVTLREWLRSNKREARAVPLPVAVGISKEILAGLSEAHDKGVVHRDLKPENVMLLGDPFAGDCRLKVLDFGIARALDKGSRLTKVGSVLGTRDYMAPEQEAGDENVGPAADLYSVGVIFYEMLMGVVPRGRWALPSTMRRELGKAVDRVCETALDAHPDRRFRSAGGFAKALGRLPGARKSAPAIFAMIFLLVLAAGGAYLLLGSGNRSVPDPSQRPDLPPHGPAAAREPPPDDPTAGPVTPALPEDPPAAPTGPFAGTLDVEWPDGELTYTPKKEVVVIGRLAGLANGRVVVAGKELVPNAEGRFEHAVGLTEGETLIPLEAFEGEEPTGLLRQFTVVLDTKRPELTVTRPADGLITRETSVGVEGTARDANLREVKIGSAVVTPGEGGGFTVEQALTEGENEIRVIAKDAAGHETEEVRRVIRDRTVPVVRIESPGRGEVVGTRTVKVRGKVEDVHLLRIRAGGRSFSPGPGGTFEVELNLPAEGENRVEVTAEDRAGNEGSATVTVVRDTSPPVLTVDALPAQVTGVSVQVTGRVDEDGCTVTLSRGTARMDGRNFTATFPLTDGANTITVTATDRAGNRSAPVTRSVRRGDGLGTGYAYDESTKAGFVRLVSQPGWSKASPLRNPQGMLRAVHGRSGLTFVLIPPGPFSMGSPEEEAGRDEDEDPHPVTIRRAFLMCETECTQGAWKRVMGTDPSFFKGDPDRPVEQVTWEDSKSWVGKAEGGLRLPSESEWEYACRAGTTGAVYAGTWRIAGTNNAAALDPIAWYGGNSGVGFDRSDGYDSTGWSEKQYAHTRAGTRKVRQKLANPWGLYDMLGNVWEWCEDWYGPYSEAPSDGSARTAQGGSSVRVYRGGGWLGFAGHCRSAYRGRLVPGLRVSSLGFRPAASLP